MTIATDAKVEWNSEKKHWQVVLQVGAEVIRRNFEKTPRHAVESQLRALAVATARDEGYVLDSEHVTIVPT